MLPGVDRESALLRSQATALPRRFTVVALVLACTCDPTGSDGQPLADASAAASQPPVPTGAPATPASASAPPADPAAWLLEGTNDERFARVARHLRGFDMAMVEVGHRYTELYWAGRDRNWEYAAYQLEKIETAVANGVERRPRRAASARMLTPLVENVRSAIGERSPQAFDSAFKNLTDSCNACHQAERMAFVQVRIPTVRSSPVVFGAPAGAAPPPKLQFDDH